VLGKYGNPLTWKELEIDLDKKNKRI
jgi:hypothetical protein